MTVAEGRRKLVKAVELAVRQAQSFSEVLTLLPRHLRRSIWAGQTIWAQQTVMLSAFKSRGCQWGV